MTRHSRETLRGTPDVNRVTHATRIALRFDRAKKHEESTSGRCRDASDVRDVARGEAAAAPKMAGTRAETRGQLHAVLAAPIRATSETHCRVPCDLNNNAHFTAITVSRCNICKRTCEFELEASTGGAQNLKKRPLLHRRVSKYAI